MFYGLRGINFHRLTPKQVIAASSYLYKSLEIFRLLPESYLHRLLGKSQVVQMENETYLYEKNEQSDFFALILDGRVEVKSGTDNFISENGPWSFLGTRALSTAAFVPDFTARVIKECSFVKILREDFLEIVQQVSQEDETFYIPPDMEWILREKSNAAPMRRKVPKTISSSVPQSISPNENSDRRTTRRTAKKSLLNDSTGDEVIDL